MFLLRRIAINNDNLQTKNLATAVIASLDQKKLDTWNKDLATEIERKANRIELEKGFNRAFSNSRQTILM